MPSSAVDFGSATVRRDPFFLRTGRLAWAALGIVIVAWLVSEVLSWISLLVVPLVLALFPAALLSPLAGWLKRHRVPNALAALVCLLLMAGVLAAVLLLIVPRFIAELPQLTDAFARGTGEFQRFVNRRLPVTFDDLGQVPRRLLGAAGGPDAVVGQGIAAARWILDFATGLILFLIALFFYLKDGRRIWSGIADLLPSQHRTDVDIVAGQIWWTLGAYLRGQLLVAFFDALFIGLGLWFLEVTLALPLALLVFLGGLFPIIGAFLSGLVAVLVALADQGLATAAIVLVIVLVVQQAEGNILEPLIMSRIIALHPLLILFAVTAGALVLGVLGAFLAVPVAAAVARIVDFVRGRPPAAGPKEDPGNPVAEAVLAGTGDPSPDPAAVPQEGQAGQDGQGAGGAAGEAPR